MDNSKYPVGAEGCSSCESGWTMYIASPMEEDDTECYHEVDYIYNRRKSSYIHGEFNKEDSDDSMASDASSAPSHQYKRANAEGSHSKESSKHGSRSGLKKLFSWKKSNEKEKKSVDHSSRGSSKHKHKK